MPALKSVPIKDADTGVVVGQRFEASPSFLASLRGSGDRPGNYTPMRRPDGVTVNANRKLRAQGYYADKGFETPKEAIKK